MSRRPVSQSRGLANDRGLLLKPAPGTTILTTADFVALVSPGGDEYVLTPQRPYQVAALADELRAGIDPSSAKALGIGKSVLDRLVSTRMMVRAAPAVSPSAFENDPPLGTVVVGLSGALSAALVLEHLHLLRCVSRDVHVVLTRHARHFIRPATLTHLGLKVWTKAFAATASVPVPHIYLAQVADLVVVMPATARTIARIAGGNSSDLLSLVVAATRAPVVVAPSMNAMMWTNAAVKRNVAQLRADGLWIVEPATGPEAAGVVQDDQHQGALGVDANALPAVLLSLLERHQAKKARGSPR